MTVLSTGQEIALPVPRYRSVLYLGRPLSDGYGVNDLPTRLSTGGGALPLRINRRVRKREINSFFKTPRACTNRLL